MIRHRLRSAHPFRPLLLEILEARCLLSATAIELPQLTSIPGQYATDHILVRFKDGVTPTALSGTALGSLHNPVPNLYDVRLLSGSTVRGALAEYSGDGRVAYAQPDQILSPAWTPNDHLFAQQWNMQNTGQQGGTRGADIRAAAAWGVTNSARQVPIAVMDTGVDYTHPDLYDNIWINQKEIPPTRLKNLVDYFHDGFISMRDLNDPRNQGPFKITDLNHNGYIDGGDLLAPMVKDAQGHDTGKGGWADGISEDHSGYVDDIIGWNSNANNNNPMDGYGHGTHVAGTIGAMGNDGIGVAGTIWNAQIVPVKFFDDSGHGTISEFIDGLNWALAHGIKISNNSWNDGGYTPALYEAIQHAGALGHLFIAAAGNNGRNTDYQPAYPADFGLDNIVSVGATDRYDHMAGFSNYGSHSVMIAAPGVAVLSTLPHGQYGTESGTSMATPHVTAVAALVWALRPEWTYQQVIAQLMSTADRLPSLTGKVESGRLDALAAVHVPPRSNGPSHTASVGPRTSTAPRAAAGLPRAALDSAPDLWPWTVTAGQAVLASSAVALPTTPAPPAADTHPDNGASIICPADVLGRLLTRSATPDASPKAWPDTEEDGGA